MSNSDKLMLSLVAVVIYLTGFLTGSATFSDSGQSEIPTHTCPDFPETVGFHEDHKRGGIEMRYVTESFHNYITYDNGARVFHPSNCKCYRMKDVASKVKPNNK